MALCLYEKQSINPLCFVILPPGVEIQCIGHFKLLFSLLRVDGCPRVQRFALEVISSVTGNQECVNDIAASEVLAYLLMALHTLPGGRELVIDTLYPLSSNTRLLKEALAKGEWWWREGTARGGRGLLGGGGVG